MARFLLIQSDAQGVECYNIRFSNSLRCGGGGGGGGGARSFDRLRLGERSLCAHVPDPRVSEEIPHIFCCFLCEELRDLFLYISGRRYICLQL